MVFFSHGNLGAEPVRDSTETESNNALGRFQGGSIAGSRTAPSVHVFRSEELTVLEGSRIDKVTDSERSWKIAR